MTSRNTPLQLGDRWDLIPTGRRLSTAPEQVFLARWPHTSVSVTKGRPAGQSATPDRVEWLRSEMLKTRVAHGYCSRDLVAEACPYANICEQRDNYVAAPEFKPALEAQLADVILLRNDADEREWESETARHNRVIESIEGHLRRLKNQT